MAQLYYKNGSEWLPLGGGSLPVGSYVYSDNNTSPASEMGGTWQALGYTAVEPIIIFNQPFGSSDQGSVTRNLMGIIFRYYNIIYGPIWGNGHLSSISNLPMTGLTDGYNAFWGIASLNEGNYTDRYFTYTFSGNAFPTLNSNMVNDPNYIFLQYTTDEALSTDVEGGKYLFKRTA